MQSSENSYWSFVYPFDDGAIWYMSVLDFFYLQRLKFMVSKKKNVKYYACHYFCFLSVMFSLKLLVFSEPVTIQVLVILCMTFIICVKL